MLTAHSLDEIEKHNTPGERWVIIDSKVLTCQSFQTSILVVLAFSLMWKWLVKMPPMLSSACIGTKSS
ncbi:hypothetical protein DL93DRAFT_2091357 [Clavulina sp. PMI_390]|nr:hypothetical protein DL93DRAFT_2091357 [Clavulina sp. PMI_390]